MSPWEKLKVMRVFPFMVTYYLEYYSITSDLERAPPGFNSVRGVKGTNNLKSQFTEDEYVFKSDVTDI
jgi:hypothetical protein